MKAVRLHATRQALVEENIPTPNPGPGELLVRVKAAGICHSDAHYRAGVSPVNPTPLTLGHEVAGIVEAVGPGTKQFKPGTRICLHYLATCGHCSYCDRGTEQFCTTGQMIGKHRDGGYAEFICIPERSVFQLPDEIPFEHGAVMMCSSATSLHALMKTRFKVGETIAIFGVGGLGISALQLAKAFGAAKVFAVDIQPAKLQLAASFGATPIHAGEVDPVKEILRLTSNRGVDVSLELIGLPVTMRQSVQVLAILGRAALVGLMNKTFEVSPYHEVLNKEAEIIGVSDHLASEIPLLLDLARRGQLTFSEGMLKKVPLDAKAINATLDNLDNFSGGIRSVIVM